MNIRLVGAVCILAGCGGIGFYMAYLLRAEQQMLAGLCRALELMKCQLADGRMPLPQMIRSAAGLTCAEVRRILQTLAIHLEAADTPDPGACLGKLLEGTGLPGSLRSTLQELAAGLGSFDLSGQLACLDRTLAQAHIRMDLLRSTRTERIRSYETLGLCAGAALAILLL